MKIYALQQFSHRQKCMGSSGDMEISSICRYDISVVTRDNLMYFCIKIANLLKFTNFILKNFVFHSHLKILKQSRYFWTSPRICSEFSDECNAKPIGN